MSEVRALGLFVGGILAFLMAAFLIFMLDDKTTTVKVPGHTVTCTPKIPDENGWTDVQYGC